jgi:hypothetical protein
MNNIILYNVILLIISLLITYLIHKYLNTNIINMSNILKKDIEKFTVSTTPLNSTNFIDSADFNTLEELNRKIKDVYNNFYSAPHNISDAEYNTLIKNKSSNKPTLQPSGVDLTLDTLDASAYEFNNLSEP